MVDYARCKYRRIKSLDELKGGDHIVVVGKYRSYYHHLLVSEVNKDSIKVIHKTNEVKEQVKSHEPKDIWLLEYSSEYTGAAAIRRARERLGEGKYNPVTANCEHFVTEVRTGKAQSIQVQKATGCMLAGSAGGALLGGGVAYYLGYSVIVIAGFSGIGLVVGALATGVVIGYLAVSKRQKEKEHND